ncbi:MAG: hypothetical protein IIA55_11635 [Gemmatimonadetes bacterium]|nr:hypothetical protein [Gemmatimonadota bacterium]
MAAKQKKKAKKKVTKRKAAKRKTTKRKATKRKATKRKATKKKATKRKATKRKATKKATKRKVTKKKPAKKKAEKKPAKKKAEKKVKKKTKRKPNPAFMRPLQLDEALSAVVGSTRMPRTEVTKQLWVYIRKNGLQDSVDRRMINADDKLKVVFNGKAQVSMFEMTKLVSRHMQ